MPRKKIAWRMQVEENGREFSVQIQDSQALKMMTATTWTFLEAHSQHLSRLGSSLPNSFLERIKLG